MSCCISVTELISGDSSKEINSAASPWIEVDITDSVFPTVVKHEKFNQNSDDFHGIDLFK